MTRRETFRKILSKMRNSLKVKTITISLLAICIFGLFGCRDTASTRIVWSPDGSKAILFASDGLRIIDAKGNLTEAISKETYPAVWMSDSKKILAVTHNEIKTWDELSSLIPTEEKTRVENAAKLVVDLVKNKKVIVGKGQNLSKEDQKSLDTATKNLRPNDLLTYIYSLDPKVFFKVINQPYDESFPWYANVDILREFQLKNNKLEANRILYKTRGEIDFLKLSPDSKSVAFIETTVHEKKQNLFALNLNTRKHLKVSNEVSNSVDWLPGSANLIYIEKRMDDQGRLTKSKIRAKDGTLVKKVNKLLLAHTNFRKNSRIQCTKDGKVFFTSTEYSVPRPPEHKRLKQKLFMTIPGQFTNIVKALSPEEYGCENFTISPDGKKVAILNRAHGQVYVYNLADGDLSHLASNIFTNHRQAKMSSIMPQWRTVNQLCITSPNSTDNTSERKAEIVLVDIGSNTKTILSKSWSKETAKFLYKVKDNRKRLFPMLVKDSKKESKPEKKSN